MVEYFIAKRVSVVLTAQSSYSWEGCRYWATQEVLFIYRTWGLISYQEEPVAGSYLFYFIYGLFNDAVRGSDFVTSSDMAIREWWIRKAVEGSSRGLLSGIIAVFTSGTEDIGKNPQSTWRPGHDWNRSPLE
jgi:hypothetical protein